MNERLNTLYTLEQKHRVSKVEELMELLDKYNKQLKEIDSFDEQIESLKKQLEVSHQELLQQAAVLSEQRKIASKAIASQLVEMVVPLGMPNMRFAIDFVPNRNRKAMEWMKSGLCFPPIRVRNCNRWPRRHPEAKSPA